MGGDAEGVVACRGRLLQQLRDAHSHLMSMRDTCGPTLVDRSRTLANAVQQVSQVASHIGDRVKFLDAVQTNGRMALQTIDSVLTLRHCDDGVRACIQEEDYEGAVQHLKQFHSLEPLFQEEPVCRILRDRERALKGKLEELLAQATESKDSQGVLRFSKLLAPLGLAANALQVYLEHVQGSLEDQAKELPNELEDDEDYVGHITLVLDLLASTLEREVVDMRETFGTETFPQLLSKVQVVGDSLLVSTLKEFQESTGLEMLLERIDVSRCKSGGGAGSTFTLAGKAVKKVEPSELDMLLDEIALLSDTSQRFLRFVTAMEEEFLPGSAPGYATKSNFGRSLARLMASFSLMERRYLELSFSTAVLEEPEDSVGEVMLFVLQKSTRRSLSTLSEPTVAAFMESARSVVVDNLLKQFLEFRFTKALKQTSFFANLQSDTHLEKAMRFLSEIESTFRHLKSLRLQYRQDAGEFFEASSPPASPGNSQEPAMFLADALRRKQTQLLESVLAHAAQWQVASTQYKEVLNNGISSVVSMLEAHVAPLLAPFAKLSYQLDEATYTSYEVNDPFAWSFVGSLDEVVNPLEEHASPELLDLLLIGLLEYVAQQMESFILQKKFTELGGLQLDKDVRYILAHFMKKCQVSVRDSFSRLTEISSLLLFQSVDEVEEHYSVHVLADCPLKEAEIRSVLALRTDMQGNPQRFRPKFRGES